MVVILILLALLGAFYLLRMWEATGEPEGDDAGTAPAVEAPEPWTPPAHSTRVLAIVISLAAGFAYYVGIPLILDGILGGDDDSEPIGCVTFVDDLVRPGGDPVLQVSVEDCD